MKTSETVAAISVRSGSLPVAIALALCLTALACDHHNGPSGADLTGFVRSNNGVGLQGATVQVATSRNAGAVATTNVDGAYRIGDVTPGRATVLARAKGYADSRQDVTVDGKNTLDFTLGLGSSPDGTKMATLSGFVGTPSSTSLPGVLVSVTSGDAAGQTATTGSDGRYTFRELPTGPTSLAASAPDFVDANSSVTVGLGNLNFMMRRTPGSISETMTGTISTSEAGCLGDGDPDDSPCRRYPFEVTNSGPLTATLTWQTGGWFDLAVLQRGQPVAWGTPPSMTPQVISKNLTAGIYEIWVSYKSSGTENFVLNVARPK